MVVPLFSRRPRVSPMGVSIAKEQYFLRRDTPIKETQGKKKIHTKSIRQNKKVK
jgi:hypothetical protein